MLPACEISAKILTIALVIAKLKYLTFDPLGRRTEGRTDGMDEWTDTRTKQKLYPSDFVEDKKPIAKYKKTSDDNKQ